MAAPKSHNKKKARTKILGRVGASRGRGRAHPKRVKKAGSHIELERFEGNPIIEPSAATWESKATFNPSALYGDGKVHLIYRAIGENDVSVFGYANSADGLSFNRRSKHPAFFQAAPSGPRSNLQIPYSSGGGWNGGSEDPRLTRMGEMVYMLYTSFDGWGSIRIALTSISFDDFVNERWNWKTPVFISPPGEVHKNWVLFPEKINGKYAILHGISPRILIDYVDDLEEFDGKKYIRSFNPNGPRSTDSWDGWLRGVGPAPIKTKEGWLVLYHAMDLRDPNRYKLGAMLLDLTEPEKILFQSSQPILEPDEHYENYGYKSGVIYSCGAVVVDGWLFVYYGGADKVACVATAKLGPFLEELTQGTAKLKRRAKK